MQSKTETNPDVAQLRKFNRLYTQKLGLLSGRLDGSDHSLTEARILYELAHRDTPAAADLARALDIDPAQLSRTLQRLGRAGLVERRASGSHGRRQLLALTGAGREAFATLDRLTTAAVSRLLETLAPGRRRQMLGAANAFARALEGIDRSEDGYRLRDLDAGDLGWIIHRQAVLYAAEYGWDWEYEGLISEILGAFVRTYDPGREQAWVADMDRTIVGSIFLMKSDQPEVAKLRLLYVEPDARGLGIGAALVDACVRRAEAVGYERLDLWTNHVLTSARKIYESRGFQLVKEEQHRSFGHDLTGQTWSLQLPAKPRT